jgi:hypothetical protein
MLLLSTSYQHKSKNGESVMSGFSHPNFGKEVRIDQKGKEVHLVFIASTRKQADDIVAHLLDQLKNGALNITLMGKPTSITEG